MAGLCPARRLTSQGLLGSVWILLSSNPSLGSALLAESLLESLTSNLWGHRDAAYDTGKPKCPQELGI